jgi:hypothetical protein
MHNNAAYIIPFASFLNPEILNAFENFTLEDSKFLKSSLYLNLVENFLTEENKTDYYFVLDECDRDFITDDFKIEKLNFHFADLKNQNLLFENLFFKEFNTHKNNIILSSDLIGINRIELDKYFNLLNIDDESLLIGKSKEGVIGVFGFNSYSVDIFNCLVKSDFNYNAFLSCIKTFNHFIHTLNDILLIKNIEHFKQLYIELSQKKSMEYCSQQMHEKFTHLFIEYKELLK